MFMNGMSESEQSIVNIQEVDAEAVETIINFAYSGRLKIDVDNVQSLLQAASLLQVPGILEKCCKFLENQIDPANCLEISTFADRYFCNELALSALKYARLNFAAVVEREEFLEVSCTQLLSLLHSDYLYVENEYQVYKAVRSWIDADLISRTEYLPNLMRCVQFYQLPEDVFKNMVSKDVNILQNLSCIEDVRHAGTSLRTNLCSDENCALCVLGKGYRLHLREMLVTVGGLTPSGERLGEAQAYDPLTNAWIELPEMPVQRSATALAVRDNYLYVTGGTDGRSVLDSVQRFCPLTNLWEVDLPALLSTRSYHTAVCFNGDLFAIGGWNKNYSVLDTAEIAGFDNQWMPAIPPLSVRRRGMGAAVFNGCIYVCGGHDGLMTLHSVECFDPNANKWLAGPSMHQARSDFGCCVVDQFLYAIGGSRKDTSSCERLSAASGRWEPIAPMNRPRPHGAVGVQVLGGCIYAMGGSDRNVGNILEKYDPLANCWTICASMQNSRCDTGLVVLKLDLSVYRNDKNTQEVEYSEE
ncbi:kelch-like protein diablo isoform X2 [Paramacrobiotus metropolitanus]|nr:kelch-like protein diablo isoform X2 [Paramacrobiotus metropolitanus]